MERDVPRLEGCGVKETITDKRRIEMRDGAEAIKLDDGLLGCGDALSLPLS